MCFFPKINIVNTITSYGYQSQVLYKNKLNLRFYNSIDGISGQPSRLMIVGVGTAALTLHSQTF